MNEATTTLTRAGCDEVLLHTWVPQPTVFEDRIGGVILGNKSGRQAVLAKAVIDATGNGDVAGALAQID